MQELSTSALRRRKTTLIGQLPNMDTVLRGSLIERYKRCGKPNCKCAKGRGHGPKHYLSISRSNARPEMAYVPKAHHAEAAEALANYRHIREILDELCAINRELLRRREAF